MQELIGNLITEEEAVVLGGERASVGEGKKNFKTRFHRR
jgi:hypothetical protein